MSRKDIASPNEEELLRQAIAAAPVESGPPPTDAELIAYRERRLDALETEQIERRIARSPESWARLRQLAKRKRSFSLPLRVAAALIATVGVALLLGLLTSPTGDLVALGAVPPEGAATEGPVTRSSSGHAKIVANGSGFSWTASGRSSRPVTLELQLAEAATDPDYAAYYLRFFGRIAVRSPIRVERTERRDVAYLRGELGEFAGTDEQGEHRVLLVARKEGRFGKLWLFPSEESSVDFQVEILSGE